MADRNRALLPPEDLLSDEDRLFPSSYDVGGDAVYPRDRLDDEHEALLEELRQRPSSAWRDVDTFTMTVVDDPTLWRRLRPLLDALAARSDARRLVLSVDPRRLVFEQQEAATQRGRAALAEAG